MDSEWYLECETAIPWLIMYSIMNWNKTLPLYRWYAVVSQRGSIGAVDTFQSGWRWSCAWSRVWL